MPIAHPIPCGAKQALGKGMRVALARLFTLSWATTQSPPKGLRIASALPAETVHIGWRWLPMA